MESPRSYTKLAWWNTPKHSPVNLAGSRWASGGYKKSLEKLPVKEIKEDALPAVDIFNANHPPRDSMDTIMGDSSSMVPTNSYQKSFEVDEDGDVFMQDLDDSAVTFRVARILEEERQGTGKNRPEVQYLSKPRKFQPRYVLVVDTSFILTHLQLVNDLVNAGTTWGNVVMLPWATIMELDGLKKSNTNVQSVSKTDKISVGVLARRANKWAFEKLASGSPGLWGQTKEESKDKDPSLKGDDAILDCCRLVKDWGYETAILSNDNNLCLKALIYEIKAVCYQGTSFTADGILSCLTSENSIVSPGIMNSDADPDRTYPSGMYQSRHAPNPKTDAYAGGAKNNHRRSTIARPLDRASNHWTSPDWRAPVETNLSNNLEFKEKVKQLFIVMENDVMGTGPIALYHQTVRGLGDSYTVSYLGVDPMGTIKSFCGMLDYVEAHWLTIFTEVYHGRSVMEVRNLKTRVKKMQQWVGQYVAYTPTSVDLSLCVEAYGEIWTSLAQEHKDKLAAKQCANQWKSQLAKLLKELTHYN